jgi:hypothetical protein
MPMTAHWEGPNIYGSLFATLRDSQKGETQQFTRNRMVEDGAVRLRTAAKSKSAGIRSTSTGGRPFPDFG